ncbi:MAG TPA: hypothetical protein VG435_12250 [Acidimicrobiales bacterium]|nr:hypothetical protein [Acidimicrobiales bacterium]
MSGVRVPIACSLDAEIAHLQLNEWHILVRRTSATVSRVSARELTMTLPDDPEMVSGVLALAQREKRCCPFFDLTVRIDADALTLHVVVPEDAGSLLDYLLPTGPDQPPA